MGGAAPRDVRRFDDTDPPLSDPAAIFLLIGLPRESASGFRSRTRRVAMPVLTVSRDEFTSAARSLSRLSKHSSATELTLTFEDDELVMSVAGAAISVPAAGEWPGTAAVTKGILVALARLEGDPLRITLGEGDQIRIGSLSTDVRWSPDRLPEIDLPLDPSLLQLLRLRLTHSDEALVSAGLFEHTIEADEEMDRLIASAASTLEPLGKFEERIPRMVREEVFGPARA